MSNNQSSEQEEHILPPGTDLNDGCYRIIHKLNQGGFGITYLAYELGYYKDIGAGRKAFKKTTPQEVVIKELYFDEFCSRKDNRKDVTIRNGDKKIEFEKLVSKQVEEGLILGDLDHTNIVVNRNIFKENGTAYIVMDYIKGHDLEEILKTQKKLDLAKAVKYATQILQAIRYIHERKIAHLDIKPSNIYIRSSRKLEKENEDDKTMYLVDDSAVLIDFGASLTYNADNDRVNATTSKLVTGISSYAPPEQNWLDNLKEFDATLDTFSMAGTLYHCLTGEMPAAPSLRSSGRSVLKMPSSFPGNELLPAYLDTACKKGLDLTATARFLSAHEFIEALNTHPETIYTTHYVNGIQHQNKFEYQKAITQFELASTQIPNRAECIASIAYCQGEYNRLKGKENQKTIENLLADAKKLQVNGKYAEAIAALELALNLAPGNGPATELLAAIKAQQLLIDTRQKFTGLMEKAARLQAERKYTDALTLAKQALELYPDDEKVKNLIVELNEQKNIATKRAKYNELYNQALQQYKNQQYPEALKSINAVIDQYPDQIGAQDLFDEINTALERTKIVTPKPPATPPKPDVKTNTKDSLKGGYFTRLSNTRKSIVIVLAAILIVVLVVIIRSVIGTGRTVSSAAYSTKVDSSFKMAADTTSTLMSRSYADNLVNNAEYLLKQGTIANLDSLSTVVTNYPVYKQKLVLLFADKAVKIGVNQPESYQFKEAALRMLKIGTTPVSIDFSKYYFLDTIPRKDYTPKKM